MDLLNEISKNAEMGKTTVRQLIGITKDVKMLVHLQRQLNTYEDLSRRAHSMLAVEGATAQEQSNMAKMSAKMGVRMKTIADNTPQNIAQMLIQGSEMGMQDMQKALSQVPPGTANNGAIALARRLQNAESEYRHELTGFL